MTLIDSNILIDIFQDDPDWYDWSEAKLDQVSANGPLLINDVIYAEVSTRFFEISKLEEAMAKARIAVVPIPREALFLAGKAFVKYGGPKTNVLPDFFIGAHAAVSGLPLLTRDVRRYRNYFPTLDIIAPE